MNVKGREEELFNKLAVESCTWNRLISFYDTIIGNNIYQILDLVKRDKIK